MDQVHEDPTARCGGFVAPGGSICGCTRVVCGTEVVEDHDLDVADRARTNQPQGRGDLGEEQEVVDHPERDARGLAASDHGFSDYRGDRQGLLGQDVLSSPRRLPYDRRPQVRRHTEVEDPDLRPLEELGDVGDGVACGKAPGRHASLPTARVRVGDRGKVVAARLFEPGGDMAA